MLPLQITFHGVPHSATAEDRIREQAQALETCYNRITGCRVVVDMPHRHHREGNAYQIRIDLTVPGAELVAKRTATSDSAVDLDAAIIEAFDDARRQLDVHLERARGFVKTHDGPPHGRVSRLFREQGYGFLTTPEGREIYFHRNSVLHGGFSRLDVGAEVLFAEEEGDKGPQASTVKTVGRHNHV
jgi:cold shock CspA family protein/ribosome-associated translation inhibitor RaiA